MVYYKQRLKRLPPEYYRGFGWVHWTLAIDERRRGWLDARFFYRFRELMAHVVFRERIACPIFCLMPDHIHLLWHGLTETTDQLLGMRHLRTEVGDSLRRVGYKLQRQPYDHVLKDNELERGAIECLVEYIARNPEREGLLGVDEFAKYPFTGCLLPGYPSVRLFESDSWNRVWRIIAFLKRTQCFRVPDPRRA